MSTIRHPGAGETGAAGHIPYADLALLWVASRLALLIVGLVSTSLLSSGLLVQKGNLVYHEPAPLPLEIWARWDSEWYLLIADKGYGAGDPVQALPPRYTPSATAGFLPLYPLLIRALSPTMGSVASGVFISNLFLAGALLLLYRLTTLEVPGDAGHQAGLAACAALLVFPTTLFLSAVYSESLFLFLALLTFERARRGRFAAAAAAGALAAVTRPFGLLLVLPVLAEWWIQRRTDPSTPRWAWVAAAGIPAGFGLFMILCARVFSDPLAFFHRQEHWRGRMSGPWHAFVRWWDQTPAVHGAHDSTLEMVTAALFIALLPIMVRRLRPSYTLYAAAGILLPLCTTVWSFGRFALTIFPAFMLVGIGWVGRQRRLVIVYAVIAATLSGFFMALFANWWWVS
ncbi:MAG: mannosyltransferase family protein [Acidobacteriota bacterium]